RPSTVDPQPGEDLFIVDEVLRSAGQPLDSATRAFMEPRFGLSLSHVRVHTDAMAADSARAVDAHAYTVGRDIVFGANEFAPTTHRGRELLAHELAHTIQQENASGASAPEDRNGGFEASAAEAGREVAEGGHVSRRLPAAERHIQRSPDGDPRWKNSVRAARYRGQVMANRIRRHGKLSKEARAKINEELAYFEGAAKETYLREVGPILKATVEIEMPAERAMPETPSPPVTPSPPAGTGAPSPPPSTLPPGPEYAAGARIRSGPGEAPRTMGGEARAHRARARGYGHA